MNDNRFDDRLPSPLPFTKPDDLADWVAARWKEANPRVEIHDVFARRRGNGWWLCAVYDGGWVRSFVFDPGAPENMLDDAAYGCRNPSAWRAS